VRQPNVRYIAAAASDSINSIVNIADAVIGAIAMQSTCSSQLAASMKLHATKTLGLVPDFD
jgi:hypothetical protein